MQIFLGFFLEKNCHYNLLGFVDQYVLKCLRFFSSQKSKLEYSFKSLSLNTRHGSRGIHFTVLHNPDKYFIIYLSTLMPRYQRAHKHQYLEVRLLIKSLDINVTQHTPRNMASANITYVVIVIFKYHIQCTPFTHATLSAQGQHG